MSDTTGWVRMQNTLPVRDPAKRVPKIPSYTLAHEAEIGSASLALISCRLFDDARVVALPCCSLFAGRRAAIAPRRGRLSVLGIANLQLRTSTDP